MVRVTGRRLWRGPILLVLLLVLISCGSPPEAFGPGGSSSHASLPSAVDPQGLNTSAAPGTRLLVESRRPAAPHVASDVAPRDRQANRPPPNYNLDTFIAVDNPRFVEPAESTLGAEELVLGYERDGVARAYPVGMVSFHHVINDTVEGRPLLITF